MEDRRAKTLEALAAFISQQKAALAETQSAIHQLRKLQSEAVIAPLSTDVGELAEQLSGSAFRLSEQAAECLSEVPAEIDWTLFTDKDPKPLAALAATARTTYAQRNTYIHTPSITSSEPSDLQKFVRDAKARILDPIFALYSSTDEDVEMPDADPASPIALKDPQKLKSQKNKNGCNGYGPSRMPPRGPSGLFARRTAPAPAPAPVPVLPLQMAVDSRSASGSTTAVDAESPHSHSPPCRAPSSPPCPPKPRIKLILGPRPQPYPPAEPPPSPPLPLALAKPVRARRISTKLAHQNHERSEASVSVGAGRRRSSTIASASTASPVVGRRRSERAPRTKTAAAPPLEADSEPEPEPEPESEEEEDDDPEPQPPTPPPTVLGKRTRTHSGSQRPDTYKVMWSASEQNLLERLLDEIPASDPRRYAKISKAMDGKRTARQVSSRVQKYLQKLRTFGVRK